MSPDPALSLTLHKMNNISLNSRSIVEQGGLAEDILADVIQLVIGEIGVPYRWSWLNRSFMHVSVLLLL